MKWSSLVLATVAISFLNGVSEARSLSIGNLGYLERETKKFTPPLTAQENPIPDPESADAEGNSPTRLDLKECVDLGIRNATDSLKATNNQIYSGEALLQSYTQFLPKLDTLGSYSYTGGRNLTTIAGPTLIDSRNYGPSLSVIASLNLFNGLADIAQHSGASKRKDAADLNLERVKQQIALDVIQAYLQVVLDQDLVGIARKNLAASYAQLHLIEKSTEAGIRNKSDYYLQKAQTASDEAYYTSTQDKKRTDLLALVQRIRLDVKKNYTLVRPALPGEPRADPKYALENDLVQMALKNRPDLKSFVQVAAASHDDITIANAPYYPKLDLIFTGSDSGRHYDTLAIDGVDSIPPIQPAIWNQLGNQVNWVAMLTLNWNIFDQGLTRLSSSQAKITADNADIDADDRQKQVERDVRQALGDYRSALQQFASSQMGLQASQKAYQLMSGRYEVGAASVVDLLTAQTTVVRAEGSYVQSVIEYVLEGHAMEVALGAFPKLN